MVGFRETSLANRFKARGLCPRLISYQSVAEVSRVALRPNGAGFQEATTKTAPFRRNPLGAWGGTDVSNGGRGRPAGFVRHY